MNVKVSMDSGVQRLNDLRGLMAVWIVLGHLALGMDVQKNLFLILQKGNLAIVGLFFFLSGYGLEKSLEKKPDYLKTFLFKKISRLFLMTWVQFGVTELCFLLLRFHRDYNGLRGVLREYALGVNWYMWELALMYLIFFVSHLLFVGRKAYFAAVLLCAALLAGLYGMLGAYAATYSCAAFPAGMIIYAAKQKLEKAAESRYGEMFIALLILTGISAYSMVMPKDIFISAAGKNVFCVFFVMLTSLIFLKLDVNTAAFKSLSRMSPEIYLYQFPAASVATIIAARRGGGPKGLTYAAAAFALTMLLALIVYVLRKTAEKMIDEN
ncbi:MAG: acyltransferase [Lachnospiraceae bacterium]|nr:acyltransferase [Lachnospiraceae bacterium]